jgi:hypothetical protein
MHVAIALQVDVNFAGAGLSAATALLAHSSAPAGDLEDMNLRRTLAAGTLEQYNARFNGSDVMGGSSIGWWHPQMPNRVLQIYGWQHLQETSQDEWPYTSLANVNNFPTGLSANRVPVCFYKILFEEAYPLSRDVVAGGELAYRRGADAPPRAVSEYVYGVDVGPQKVVFMTRGLTIDEPALGRARSWIGRSGVQFWEVTEAAIDGTVLLGDFSAAMIAPGQEAASRRTTLTIPFENIEYGMHNHLNYYIARPSHMVETMLEAHFREQTPAGITPWSRPQQSRFSSVAALLQGLPM